MRPGIVAYLLVIRVNLRSSVKRYSHMRYKRFFENLPKNQHLPRFCHLKTPFLLQQPKLTIIFALNHIIYNQLILLILELIFRNL
jgi:hypothetical protein